MSDKLQRFRFWLRWKWFDLMHKRAPRERPGFGGLYDRVTTVIWQGFGMLVTFLVFAVPEYAIEKSEKLCCFFKRSIK